MRNFYVKYPCGLEIKINYSWWSGLDWDFDKGCPIHKLKCKGDKK